MNNSSLIIAKHRNFDEFYTEYADIEKELKELLKIYPRYFNGKTIINPCDGPESNFTRYFKDNFNKLGLKKLISTCYNPKSKASEFSLFESSSQIQKNENDNKKGLYFEKTKNSENSKNLKGNGDFFSDEIISYIEKSDIVITNPPFSLFRKFFAVLIKLKKDFMILGNIQCITYKHIFPLIKDNKIFIGKSIHNTHMEFAVPENYKIETNNARTDDAGNKFIKVAGIRWFTNIDYAVNHEIFKLHSMKWNLENSKHAFIKNNGYLKYDNFDAIEIPFNDAIPNDYKGLMSVPITFIDKYNPDQFIIKYHITNIYYYIGSEKITPYKRLGIMNRF